MIMLFDICLILGFYVWGSFAILIGTLEDKKNDKKAFCDPVLKNCEDCECREDCYNGSEFPSFLSPECTK